MGLTPVVEHTTFLILRCDPGLEPGEPRRTHGRQAHPRRTLIARLRPFPRAGRGRSNKVIPARQTFATMAHPRPPRGALMRRHRRGAGSGVLAAGSHPTAWRLVTHQPAKAGRRRQSARPRVRGRVSSFSPAGSPSGSNAVPPPTSQGSGGKGRRRMRPVLAGGPTGSPPRTAAKTGTEAKPGPAAERRSPVHESGCGAGKPKTAAAGARRVPL
jgi:hypothetical protein